MFAAESGERARENTVLRDDGRGHVLLHRGWDRVDQMDREAQVITFSQTTVSRVQYVFYSNYSCVSDRQR